MVMRRWSRGDDPMAYLRRAMINQRSSRWRRLSSREFVTADLPDAVSADAADRVAERQTVVAALRTLSPLHRIVSDGPTDGRLATALALVRVDVDEETARRRIRLGAQLSPVLGIGAVPQLLWTGPVTALP